MRILIYDPVFIRKLSLAEKLPSHRRYKLDGGDVVPAAPVRLSCECPKGGRAVRDFKNDGAEIATLYHEPGYDGELGFWHFNADRQSRHYERRGVDSRKTITRCLDECVPYDVCQMAQRI